MYGLLSIFALEGQQSKTHIFCFLLYHSKKVRKSRKYFKHYWNYEWNIKTVYDYDLFWMYCTRFIVLSNILHPIKISMWSFQNKTLFSKYFGQALTTLQTSIYLWIAVILTITVCCLSRWLTAPVETVSITCAAARWSVAPVDFLQTNPATAPWPPPPDPSAVEVSLRVYCRSPSCSAPALLARWAMSSSQRKTQHQLH